MSSAKNGCANFCSIYNEEHRIVTLLTSHYMQDIEELCHRVLVIDHGKIFFDGPLDEIIDRFSAPQDSQPDFRQTSHARFFGLWRNDASKHRYRCS